MFLKKEQPTAGGNFYSTIVDRNVHVDDADGASLKGGMRNYHKKSQALGEDLAFQISKLVPLLEQTQDALARAVGDRERLDAELLLHLQGLQAGRLFVHVGVDELADAAFDCVHETGDERRLDLDARL